MKGVLESVLEDPAFEKEQPELFRAFLEQLRKEEPELYARHYGNRQRQEPPKNGGDILDATPDH